MYKTPNKQQFLSIAASQIRRVEQDVALSFCDWGNKEQHLIVDRRPCKEGVQVVIKFAGGKIVGTEVGDSYFVDWVWVPRDQRNKGIGKALVQAAKDITGKLIVPGCVLEDSSEFWASATRDGLAKKPVFRY